MAGLLAARLPQHSFERLYRRHVGDVYRYAAAVLSNAADAEDVTQTTFLNAYRAYQRGERPREPLNWLIAIAHNVCRQRFRQAARRPREVALDYDPADELVADDGVRAEDIRRALSMLAFNQRSALVMRELEGRSYAEIAAALDLSVGAVETLLFRARRALREQLETSLTCSEAERSISRQLDGVLERGERGALRAHLRACPDCAAVARQLRAQRKSLRPLGLLPVPASLASFSTGGAAVGGAAAVSAGAVLKVAAAVTAGVAVSGAGYEVAHKTVIAPHHRPPAAVVAAPARSRAHVVLRKVSAPPAYSRRSARGRAAASGAIAHAHARAPQSHAGGSADSASRAVPATRRSPAQAKPASAGNKPASKRHFAPVPKPSSPTPRQSAVAACALADQVDPAAFGLAYGKGGRASGRCVRAHAGGNGSPHAK